MLLFSINSNIHFLCSYIQATKPVSTPSTTYNLANWWNQFLDLGHPGVGLAWPGLVDVTGWQGGEE